MDIVRTGVVGGYHGTRGINMSLLAPRAGRILTMTASAVLVSGVAAVALWVVPAQAATPVPSVVRIAPITAPAGTSIAMTVYGHHFDTTIGATAVTFDGIDAVSVDCVSPSTCKVVTPNLPPGTVSVVVTTDGTPLNPETLTVTSYVAPLVRIVDDAKGVAVFSQHTLADSYPAQGLPGNDAVTIQNTTGVVQTITNTTTGPVALPPGGSETFSLAATLGPYIFFTTGTPTSALTVKTK